jgi:hypothetical protein
MPFTPIHMGPGMAVKAAVPRHFSIVVFGLTQIALDLEVLWHLARRDPPLHRFWHTFLGATVVAAALAVIGKPAARLVKSIWNRVASHGTDADLSVPVHTSWAASASGAFVGAYSHILLDSMFHADVGPLKPWSAANPLRGIINPMMLQMGCLILGLIGIAWFFRGGFKVRKAGNRVEDTGSGRTR